MPHSFPVDERRRLQPPILAFKMDVAILEVGKTRRLVLETVNKRVLQDPAVDLPSRKKPQGFKALVPRVSRKTYEVSLCETLPRFGLKEIDDRSLELLDSLLVLAPERSAGDELPGDEREPVGGDLVAREDIKNEELLFGRVDLNRLILVPGGQLVAAGPDRDAGLLVCRPRLPAEQRLFPENGGSEGPEVR